MGLIHIYCGDGKGKTTAAVGLAVRMAGSGGQVVIARFLKDEASSEVNVLRGIKGIEVLPCGRGFGFTWQMTEEVRQEAAAYYKQLLADAFERAVCLAKQQAEQKILLILDEVCAAINSGLIEEKQLLLFLDSSKEWIEVVMTGRDPLPSMAERADYISELQKKKHPFDNGVTARKGIEY